MYRRGVMKPGLPAVTRSAALLMFVVVVGCGSQLYPELSESDKVSGLVSSLCDAAGDPKGFASLFADGAAPPESERVRYRRSMYGTTSVKISGDSATASVRVKDFDGNLLGEIEWTAVRVGETWKLQKAPLP